MGFRIWAVGYKDATGKKFHYVRDHCLDKGDFDPPKLLSMIPGSPDAAGVAKKIVGNPASNWGSAEAKGIFAIADIECAHFVVTEMNLLALHGSGGNVSVYCKEKNNLWADTVSYNNYLISTSAGNPGREFLRQIAPGLKSTSLNNFGVLLQIAFCLHMYQSAWQKSSRPHLRISLFH